MNIDETYLCLNFLVNFNFIKEDKIISKFILFLASCYSNCAPDIVLKNYGNFIAELNNRNFSDYTKNLILKSQVEYSANIQKELNIISGMLKIDYSKIKELLEKKYNLSSSVLDNLPEFSSSEFKIDKDEFNNFSQNRAFFFDDDFEIRPLEFSETTRFYDLKGYDEQKRILKDNTLALLNGKKVNNILLYGDSGCGKSTSVRALLNEFEQLRMVQIFKNNLINLDKLYEKLKDKPYKFIIFADDISFDDADNTFSTMKAVLEGSLIQCPKNAVIYATSNRRHLVKETFKAREGDEIHLNDTINELSSLSERFGINLLYLKPSYEEYLKIVLELAKDKKLNIDEKTLLEHAKKDSLLKASRSPRTAKQLIENLENEVYV